MLGTPAFAAVSTAVKLAEREVKTRPYKALVNAVLRGIEREGPGPTDAVGNLPDWIAARWRQTYGEAALQGLAQAATEEPATDLSLKPDQDPAALAALVEGEVMPGGSVPPGMRGDVATWPGYETARGGSRTPPPPFPSACWPPRTARPRWTCAPRPVARRCNWPPPGRRSPRWTARTPA